MEIKIINLSYAFGKKEVLKDFNCIFLDNEFVMITGKSGCGKTTLLRCLTGELVCNSGHIYYDNYDLYLNRDYLISKSIGYVSQEDNLIDELTVAKQIRLNAAVSLENWDEEWYQTLIETLKLNHLLKKYPKHCSVGECQRIALACALIKKPHVLYLDEPTGSLDEANTQQFIQLLLETRKKYACTIVMVTHETNLLRYASKIIDLTKKNCMKVSMPLKTEKEVLSKRKNYWLYQVIENYYQFHLWNGLAHVFCVTLLFISFYLAIDAGTEFKNYILHEAQSKSDARLIQVSSEKLVDGRDYPQILALDHVANLDYQTMKFRYAYERWADQPMEIQVGSQILTDNDTPLNFHGFDMSNCIAGVCKPKQTDLVLSDSIVAMLGYSPEKIVGMEISYQVPYAIGYDRAYHYDTVYGQTSADYYAVTERMGCTGRIVGVCKDEYFGIYHDNHYFENLVYQKMIEAEKNAKYLSAFSSKEITVEVDDFSYVPEVMTKIEEMGYTCHNSIEYLVGNLENLDRMAAIYQYVLIFVSFVMLFVFKVLFDASHQNKVRFCQKLKRIGVISEQIKRYIILDALYMLLVSMLFSIVLLNLALPVVNRLFVYMNEMILYIQFAANKGTPLFTFSVAHVTVGMIAVIIVTLLAMVQLYRLCRRNKLC